jgi:L-threonylcarbamoyladenylate synthase
LNPRVEAAAHALMQGEIVAIPTETVYGLAADASNAKAIQQIYAVKGRPANHPLIVHVASLRYCEPWIDCRANPLAYKRLQMLGLAFWPGPLTLIVPRNESAPSFASAEQTSVGLRIPAHNLTLHLLRKFHDLGGLGLAAPSANRFGKVSPTSAAHVVADLGEDIQWILDGGDCEVGLESTIVDISSTPPRLLRPGAISLLQVSQCLDEPVALGANQASPQVSGSLASHYAPATTLQLCSERSVIDAVTDCLQNGLTSVGLWAPRQTFNKFSDSQQRCIRFHEAKNNPEAFSHELYAVLRAIDTWGVSCAIVQAPPDHAIWFAVKDRLTRASF